MNTTSRLFVLSLLLSTWVPKLAPVGIALLLIHSIYDFIRQRRKLVLGWSDIFFPLIFTLYLVGVLWTHDNVAASKTIEYKLAFLLFPAIFLLVRPHFQWNNVLKSWVVITLGLFSFELIRSILFYQPSLGLSSFLSSNISTIHHPTYAGNFYLSAWFILLVNPMLFEKKWARSVAVALLFVATITTMSMGVILSLLLLIFLLSFVLVKRHFGRHLTWVYGLLFPILGYLFVTQTPYVEAEWHGSTFYLEKYVQSPDDFVQSINDESMSGSELRLLLWTVSAQLIQEQPWGYGTGNVDEALSKKLNQLGFPLTAEKNYNPHNQFLQIGIEIGLLGLILFTGGLIALAYFAIREQNYFLLFVVSLLFFNGLFESMLQRQSGVLFFVPMVLFALTYISSNARLSRG